MPARRKPFEVLEATGAFRKDPKRRLARLGAAHSAQPVGVPPDYFDHEHRKVWYELVSEAKPGTLSRADRKHLELTVRLICRLRIDPVRVERMLGILGGLFADRGLPQREIEEWQAAMQKELTPTAGEGKLLLDCLVGLGMNPRDRSATR